MTKIKFKDINEWLKKALSDFSTNYYLPCSRRMTFVIYIDEHQEIPLQFFKDMEKKFDLKNIVIRMMSPERGIYLDIEHPEGIEYEED